MAARGGRVFVFGVTMIIVVLLIYLSAAGALGPFENVVAVPLNFVQSIFGRTSGGISGLVSDVSDYRRLRQRNDDLEEALAIYQSNLAQLREKAEDYDRLAELLGRGNLRETDFTSQVPIVGPLIVAVRRLWNWMSTKWYVRPILGQQSEVNALTTRLLSDLAQWHEMDGQRLRELESRVAELEARLEAGSGR